MSAVTKCCSLFRYTSYTSINTACFFILKTLAKKERLTQTVPYVAHLLWRHFYKSVWKRSICLHCQEWERCCTLVWNSLLLPSAWSHLWWSHLNMIWSWPVKWPGINTSNSAEENKKKKKKKKFHWTHESGPAWLYVEDKRGENLDLFTLDHSGFSEADLQHNILLVKCK